MAVASDYSGEEYCIPPAQLAPAMGTANAKPHAVRQEHWKDPLDFKHGFSGLEVKDMAAHAMGEPPAVEPSMARHLNPTQGGLLAQPRPTLPNKMECFTATIHQASYRASALACVQACGRSMALSVAGERALWLNLSGLPDSEKRRIAGAPVEPVQALFGPALTLTQQRCDDKKEDEAFKLCLPRRATPHLPPTMRAPQPPSGETHCTGNGICIPIPWKCYGRDLATQPSISSPRTKTPIVVCSSRYGTSTRL
ncbi:hypothetical protein SKAU_G00042490 [Synaphobranchus kaupii]|uniref:Uncharacterized protein n=1 Tax=Synaphobranchus kaupii TaxID=118154 RepID=A0A9Q1G1G0_SYNKA|nr:hypothetical protein SKAU_G00042490 [Synaphobranchus kaupii]